MPCGRGHLRDRRAALLPGDASYTLCAVRMQRLEPFVALLLIRQRPTHTAGGGQHWELGAAVTSLPSGVLAMVCEAMMKLKVRLASSFGCVGHRRRRGPTRSRSTCTVLVKYGGQSSPLGVVRPYEKYYKYYL